MGRPLKIKMSTTKDIGFNNVGSLTAAVYPATLNSDQYFGVVGGLKTVASASYPVIRCRARNTGQSEEDAVIVRQKGSTKYLVYGLTTTTEYVATLANEATSSLSEGNMNIAIFRDDSTDILVKRLTNKWALDYSDNRYLLNFFTDEGTAIVSGTKGDTVSIAITENYTS